MSVFTLFSSITGVGTLIEALKGVLVSAKALFLAAGEQVLNFLGFIAAGALYLLANRKYLVLFLLFLLGFGVGVGFVYHTSDTGNVVNQGWVCKIRPVVEWIKIYAFDFVHWAWEGLSRLWNIIIRYIWEECFTVFWEDFKDWWDFMYGVITGIDDRWNDTSASVKDRILGVAYDIGSVIMRFFELFQILYSSIVECASYAWTQPRDLWALPVPTFFFGGSDIVARYFPKYDLVLSPTNAPTPPFPTPAPGTPIPPPGPTFSWWEGSAYEFNPRYGAFATFLNNLGWSDYVRKSLVAAHNAYAFSARTVFIILRTFRTPQLSEFWGGLIVDANSAESLWGAVADSVSHFEAFWISVLSVPDKVTCAPEGPGMNDEYSHHRFALEKYFFEHNRYVAELARVVSLILYDTFTGNVPGIPFLDAFYKFFNTGGSDLRTNLFIREITFCEIHYDLAFQVKSWNTRVRTCPWMKDYVIPGIHSGGNCYEWNGQSSATYFGDAKWRVAHARLLWRALFNYIYSTGLRVITFFQVITCNSFPTNTGLGQLITNLLVVVDKLRRCIETLIDALVALVYMVVATPCLSLPTDKGFFAFVAKYIFIDILLQRTLPCVVSFFTQYDCIKGQNIFECILMELSLIDPSGIFYLLCEFVNGIVSAIENIGLAISTVVNFIFEAIESINYVIGLIGSIGKFLLSLGEALTDIGALGDCAKAIFTLGFAGTCESFDIEFNYTGPSNIINIDPVDITASLGINLNLLLPCTVAEHDTYFPNPGPLVKRDVNGHELAWLKENPDYDSNNVHSSPYVADLDEYVRIFYMKTENKKHERNTPFNGDKVFTEIPLSDEERAYKIVREKLQNIVTPLRLAAAARDARVYYAAVQKCYLGQDEVPSQFELCKTMEYLLLNQTYESSSLTDNACITSRCARVAQQCVKDHTTRNARRLGNPNLRNYFVDSWFGGTLNWMADTFMYASEALTCYNATEILRRDSASPSMQVKLTLGTMAFAYGSAEQVAYIGKNFALAYYGCLNDAQDWATETIDRSGIEIVEHFVHCLEAPYVEEPWRAPEEAHGDAIVAFRAYMDEQGLTEHSNEACTHLLRQHGLLFDTDNKDIREHARKSPTELMAYRACSMAHAFGTRATLAAHIWVTHGAQEIGKKKIATRDTQKMWFPMPGKKVELFLSTWRGPVQMMRSAWFLNTDYEAFLENGMQRFSNWFTSLYSFGIKTLPAATRLLRRFMQEEYASIAASVRLVDLWADVYSEIIEPSDLLQRLQGRSDKVFIAPIHRGALVKQWHTKAAADIQQLVTFRAKNNRRMNVKDDVTLAAFHRSGQHLRRRRLDDLHDLFYTNSSSKERRNVELEEVFEGVDEQGREMWTINLDEQKKTERKRNVYERAEESIGEVINKFSSSMSVRLNMKLDEEDRDEALYAPGVARPTQKFKLRQASESKEVKIDFIIRRGEHFKHRLHLDARIHVDRNSLKNMSATWNYEPFAHIDVQKSIAALQKFIARAKTDPQFAEDLSDARRAYTILQEMAGPVVKYGTATIRTQVQEYVNLTAQGVQITPYELQRRRESAYRIPDGGAISSALTAFIRIQDRRYRVLDLPPVQAMGALLSALSSNNADLLAGWLAGDLGYVNGIGFVQRAQYEYYMLDMENERSRWLAGGLRPPDSAVVSRRMTPFFMIGYDQHIREAPEREKRREELIQNMNIKLASIKRKRHETSRMNMLIKSGRWQREMTKEHSDEHTYHMVRRLAPHVHDTRWRVHGIHHDHLHRILRDVGDPHKRTLHERTLVQRAVVIAVTDLGTPSLGDIIDVIDSGIEWLFGKPNVLRNFGQSIIDAAGVAYNLLKDWNFWAYLFDVFDAFTCTVPDDYALEGTGTYGWGCLLMGYLPERLFKQFGLWPTNVNRGDIPWPDEAFVSGSLASQCSDLPNGFNPEIRCPNSSRVPLYESFTNPRFCMTTRFGTFPNFGENDPACETAKVFDNINDDDDGYPLDMPLCPRCSACTMEFLNCADVPYGTDPFRVVQVYLYHLEWVWDEAFDVTNNVFPMFLVLIFSLIAFNHVSTASDVSFWMLVALFFYALFTSLETWFVSAAVIVVLVILWEPAAVIFFIIMLWRTSWYQNQALYAQIFDTTFDPSWPPYYNLAHEFSNLLETIADSTLRIPWTSISLLPSPLGHYLPFLQSWADSLTLFEGAGVPTVFENLCSGFGFWTVVASVAGGAVVIYGSYVAIVIGVGVLNLVIAVLLSLLLAISFLFFFLALPFILLYRNRSAIAQERYDRELDVREAEDRAHEETKYVDEKQEELRQRVDELEEEVQLERKGRVSPPPPPTPSESFLQYATSLPDDAATLRKRNVQQKEELEV